MTKPPRPGDRTRKVGACPCHLAGATLREKPAPCTPKEVSADQVARIEVLQRTFAEHDRSALDRWLQDFRCEADPERELRIYEAMGQACRAYVCPPRGTVR